MDEKLKQDLALHRQKKADALDKEKQKALALKKKSMARQVGRANKHYKDKEKIIALETFAQTGSWVVAARESGIGYEYLRNVMSKTQWWKDSLKEVRAEQDDVLDGDLSEIINDSVSQLKDRVKNGDWMWNSKENKFVRKALPARELHKISTGFMDQRNVMRGKPTRITEQVSINDRLAQLAANFENFQKARTVPVKAQEVIDVDIIEDDEDVPSELQGGVPEVSGDSGTDQEQV